MNTDKLNSDFFMNKLFESALKDKKITKEEDLLLRSIKLNLDNYLNYLDEALSDGIISVSEHTKLLDLQNMIFQEAETTARIDQIISEDEELLLNTLKGVLLNQDNYE